MIAAYLLIGLTVIVLISFYSCLDHIFVPRINKRLDDLEKQINELIKVKKMDIDKFKRLFELMLDNRGITVEDALALIASEENNLKEADNENQKGKD